MTDQLTHAISFDYTSVKDLEFNRIPKRLQRVIVSDLEKLPCPCVVLVYSESTWCRVYLHSSQANSEDAPSQETSSADNDKQLTRFSMELNGVSLDFGGDCVTLVLSAESLQCPFCDVVMTAPPTESDWSTHIANHLELRYCSECGDKVTGEPSAHEHQSRKPPIKPRPNQNDVNEQKTEDPVFVCHYCQAFFSTRMALAEHVNSHNVLQRYMCENCGRQFSTVGSLNRHRRQQHRDRVFGSRKKSVRCRTCNQIVSRCLRQYMLHVSRAHKSEKRICHICGRTFPLIGRMRKHVQDVHISSSVQEAIPSVNQTDAASTSTFTSAIFLLPNESTSSNMHNAVYVQLDAGSNPPDDAALDAPGVLGDQDGENFEMSADLNDNEPPFCSTGVDNVLPEPVTNPALPPVSSSSNFDESSNCSFSSTLLASPSKYFAAYRQ